MPVYPRPQPSTGGEGGGLVLDDPNGIPMYEDADGWMRARNNPPFRIAEETLAGGQIGLTLWVLMSNGQEKKIASSS